MFSTGRDQRNRTQMYNPMRPYANYCKEALQKTEMKREYGDMKLDFENEIILNNLHLIPDPLMKNLADTLITAEQPEKLRKLSLETPKMPESEVRPESTLAGITNFFSGVFSMLSDAVFRTRSPVHYYDCFEADSRQGSPRGWHRANIDEGDKNGQTLDKLSSDASSGPNEQSDMNTNCKSTVTSCEEKLIQVKCLLKNPKPPPNPTRLRRRPKKVFVEPGSVQDSFEDAFAPEDFVALPNDPTIEYCSPKQWCNESLIETVAPETKIDIAINESTEIVKDVTEKDTQDSVQDDVTHGNDENNKNGAVKLEKDAVNVESDNMKLDTDKNYQVDSNANSDTKQQLVSSCEDKLSKLKALLQEKRKKNTTDTNPEPEPTVDLKVAKTIPILNPIDKHYKNPHRMLDKRRKMKMKRAIQEDVCFASEIDDSSVDNSPTTINSSSDTSLGEYFDELKGCFQSASTESEDSFQIVFNDVPKRCRKVSDCDSEDSFIVFEDTPDCFTSNDVFGDESDSDSDVSDSGCSTMTCKLTPSLSRTVSNLTDDTLYESGDEVDCARVVPELKSEVESKGLLMDAHKKSLRKDQPAKKVTFSTEPPKVRVMRVWAFAAKQARAGHWERYALDRDRFKRRIADVDMAVSWVLKPQHRSRVMFQRFMPWWNAQRRKELAEKKEKEEERKKLEAEKDEEQKRQEVAELLEDGQGDFNQVEEFKQEDRKVEKDLEGIVQNQEEGTRNTKDVEANIKNAVDNKDCNKQCNKIGTKTTINGAEAKTNSEIGVARVKKQVNGLKDSASAFELKVHKIPKDKIDNYERNKIGNVKVNNTLKHNNSANNSGKINGKIGT